MSINSQLKSKAMYYAFGRNDAGNAPYVDAGDFSNAFVKHYEDTGHIANVQTAFERFSAGEPIGGSDV